MFIHVYFIITIILMLFIVYRIYRKERAYAYYEFIRRYVPSFFVWPKNKKSYIRLQRILALIALVVVIFVYILAIRTL